MLNKLPKLNRKANIILMIVLVASGALAGGGYYIHEQSKDIRELAHKSDTASEGQDIINDNEGGGVQENTANTTNEPSNVTKDEAKKDSQNTSKSETKKDSENASKVDKKKETKKDDVVDNKSSESIPNNESKDDRVNTGSKSTTQNKSTVPKQSTPYNTRKSDGTNSKVNHKSTAQKHNTVTHSKPKGNTSKPFKRTIVYDASLSNATWNAWNNYRESNGVKRLSYSQAEASRSYVTAKEDAIKQSASHGYSQCGLMAPSMSASGIINSFASSEGHRENLLDSHSIYGGVAVFKTSDGMIYCVLSFSDGW